MKIRTQTRIGDVGLVIIFLGIEIKKVCLSEQGLALLALMLLITFTD